MEIATESPVTLTAGAIKELKNIIEDPGFDKTKYLRFGVKGGGCSGLSYVLGFDDKLNDDIAFQIEGIDCVMTKAHELYLLGMEIDFQGGLNTRGFTFSNPNATKTCGCGTSFAV